MKFLAIYVLLAGSLCAADIYVDAGSAGNDSNPGTVGSPMKTLSAALTAANNGDTVILRGGSYAGDVTVNNDNLTIRSYTGEWAVISTGTSSSGQAQCIWINADSCTLRGLEIVGGYNYCIKIEGTTNHIIEDCIVRGAGRDCFKLVPHSDGTTIRRCEIYDSGQRDSSNAEGIDNVNADNMHVVDCYIHDVATNGVYAKGGAVGCVIERNLIMDCGTGGIFLGFNTDSVWMNNPGYDNNPQYYENIDGTARNNIIVNTVFAGIGMCSAQNPKIYNNTLINVATGGMSALHFHPRDGDNDMNPECTGVDIRNNIVSLNQGSRPLMNVRTSTNSLSQPYDTLDTSTFTMDYNYYFRAGSSVHFRNDQSGQTNQSLSQWASAMGTDANSTEGDPDVNATTYHLNGSSNCIDAGTTLPHTDDYDGNTRSGAYDIGADEPGGTALTTPPPAGTIGTGGGGSSSPTAPNTPNNFSASALGGLIIRVTWNDVGNETGYELERRDSGGSFALIQTLAADTTTYNDTGLSDGVSYTYRVRAFNGVGNSAYSIEDTATATQTAPPTGGNGGSGGSSSGGGGCVIDAHGKRGWVLVLLTALGALALRRQRAS